MHETTSIVIDGQWVSLYAGALSVVLVVVQVLVISTSVLFLRSFVDRLPTSLPMFSLELNSPGGAAVDDSRPKNKGPRLSRCPILSSSLATPSTADGKRGTGDRSEEEIRRITNLMCRGMVIPVVVSDAKGKILEVNTSVCELFGYAQGELIGRSVEKLMPVHIAEQHAGLMRRYVTRGRKECVALEHEEDTMERVGCCARARRDRGSLMSMSSSSLDSAEDDSLFDTAYDGCIHLPGPRNGRVVGEGRPVRARHREGRLIDVHLSVNAVSLSEDPEDLLFVATLQDITALLHAAEVHRQGRLSLHTIFEPSTVFFVFFIAK